MALRRLIARLDVKGPNLIKGVHLEGLRVLGEPASFAQRYYETGIDEIIYMDIVASLYGRNSLTDLVQKSARNVFVPITVGGGIRSVEDAFQILRAGADKIAINTAAVRTPELITKISRRFGAQCVVLSIEAKRQRDDSWEAYTDNGRERTGLDVVEWAVRGVEMGAGEILLTSVDREGTARGMDLELLAEVSAAVRVPIIASGGVGSSGDVHAAFQAGGASAVAMAHVLHYKKLGLDDIRGAMSSAGVMVRQA